MGDVLKTLKRNDPLHCFNNDLAEAKSRDTHWQRQKRQNDKEDETDER